MLNELHVLPTASGEPDEIFPLRLRLRLRDKFGLLLRELRKRSPAFRALKRGPWSVFLAIASHFELNEEAWPGQEAIAETTGYCARAVRFHIAALESGGLLVMRHERRPDGGERIFYRPGPVMVRELAAFDRDYPKDRPKALPPANPRTAVVRHPSHLPEGIAGPPAERVSMEPDHNQKEPSSCVSEAAGNEEPLDEEEQPRVTGEDRELARWALAERMKRKRPKAPPPRWFDRKDVEMVARCAAAVEGGRAAKQLALRMAIVGAFSASKDGPPTARFIWEKLEHFLEHVERGRHKLLVRAHDAQQPGSEADRELRRAMPDLFYAAAERAQKKPQTRAELAAIRAEFEEIAAHTGPEFRRYLESMIATYRKLEAKARE